MTGVSSPPARLRFLGPKAPSACERLWRLAGQKHLQVIPRCQLEEELPALSALYGGDGQGDGPVSVDRDIDHGCLLAMNGLVRGQASNLMFGAQVERPGVVSGHRSDLEAWQPRHGRQAGEWY